jgi:hypothetical protein
MTVITFPEVQLTLMYVHRPRLLLPRSLMRLTVFAWMINIPHLVGSLVLLPRAAGKVHRVCLERGFGNLVKCSFDIVFVCV